ncbi:hypothetical protein KFE25_002463 [Diacronema lutheri]|uniref:R3H domain-containing protein n=2 Tax=Diacronema lutheri TaxID=2081491 RepID=A0A8J5X2C3_DIALT|nr:hypothetical protein KFE25_002463 [Diacronema lutheri]
MGRRHRLADAGDVVTPTTASGGACSALASLPNDTPAIDASQLAPRTDRDATRAGTRPGSPTGGAECGGVREPALRASAPPFTPSASAGTTADGMPPLVQPLAHPHDAPARGRAARGRGRSGPTAVRGRGSAALSMDELLGTLSAPARAVDPTASASALGASLGRRRGRGRGRDEADTARCTAPLPQPEDPDAERAIARDSHSNRGRAREGDPLAAVAADGRDRARGRGRGRGRIAEPGRAHGGGDVGGGRGGGGDRWWRRLTDVDPISLEPLSQLPHAPFGLAADGAVLVWFEPDTLSSYLVSTANFAHPISRRPLSRDDCARLDAHCAQHGLAQLGVADAFDHRAEYAAAAAVAAAAEPQSVSPPSSRVAERQAEAAAVLRSLFARRASGGGGGGAEGSAARARGAARRGEGGGGGGGARSNLLLPAPGGGVGGALPSAQRERTGAGRARVGAGARAPTPSQAVSAEGNLTLVDDDDARHMARSGVGDGGGGGGGADDHLALLFPPLPPSAPPPPRVEPPPRTQPRAPPRAPADAAATAAAAAAATAAADAEQRRRLLASAFGVADPAKHASMFAQTAAADFSAEVLALARASPALVTAVESALDEFLASGERRRALEPMARVQRALVHEAARKYGVTTGSYGDEPRRRVDLFRTEKQAWPPYRLSDAARALGGTLAASASADGASVGYELAFTDVESAEAVYALLRPSGGDVSLAWTSWADERRTRPTAGTATFTTRGAFDAAQQRAGGGLRGAYRVSTRATRAPPLRAAAAATGTAAEADAPSESVGAGVGAGARSERAGTADAWGSGQ